MAGDAVHRCAARLDALAGGAVVRGDLRTPMLASADLAGRVLGPTRAHGKHPLTRVADGWTPHSHLRRSGSWTMVRTHGGKGRPLLPGGVVVSLVSTGSGRGTWLREIIRPEISGREGTAMAVAADIERATDSTTDWVAEHVRQYVASGGTEGHDWRGVPTLVLVTSGSRSGEPRRTGLIYGTSGDDLVIVASVGGAPEDPQWYRNLRANPEAGVLVGTRRLTVRARTATSGERGPLWERMAQIFPNYEDYARKTDREIPIVLLTPES